MLSDLTHDEKIKLTTKHNNDKYIVIIWTVTLLNNPKHTNMDWLVIGKYNTWDVRYSYNPELVIYNDLAIDVFDVDNIKFYKLID